MFHLRMSLFVVGFIVVASTLFWARKTQPPISNVQRETELRSDHPSGIFDDAVLTEITPEVLCPASPNQDLDQWKTIQLLRKENLERECRRFFLTSELNFPTLTRLAEGAASRPNLQNILVDDKHRVLYCYIPKIACTNWKKMMLLLTGEAETNLIEEISNNRAHFGNKLKPLIPSKFSRQEIVQRLKSYTKFLIVRHPLERLLSAYKNKFVAKTPDAKAFQKYYAVKMMMYARNTTNVSSPGVGMYARNTTNVSSPGVGMYAQENRNVPASGEGMKFDEFLRFLTSRPNLQFQEHWASYFHMCHPCTINYDFIGMYETLEIDSNSILKLIGAPPNLKFPSYKPSRTSKELELILESLPPELIEAIYKSYYADYRIFNYNKMPHEC